MGLGYIATLGLCVRAQCAACFRSNLVRQQTPTDGRQKTHAKHAKLDTLVRFRRLKPFSVAPVNHALDMSGIAQDNLRSAGVILFRHWAGTLEVLQLYRCGRRWTVDIPKGRQLLIDGALEEPRSCCVRETYEETGLTPLDYVFIENDPLPPYTYRTRRGIKSLLCFVAILQPAKWDEPQVRTSAEHNGGHGWVWCRHAEADSNYGGLVTQAAGRMDHWLRRTCAEALTGGLPPATHPARATCVICLHGEASYGFLHDDKVHLCVCAECQARGAPGRMRSCPICRAGVRSVVKVYDP